MQPCLFATLVLLQATAVEPEFQRLDDGLRVVVVENHTLPLASVQLWYRVGSAHDHVARPGLCQVGRTVLEHRADAALRLRAAGVRFESRTLRDACYFASVLPPEYLGYVLKIEAERMKNRPVDRADLDATMEAAARDLGLKPDDPATTAQRVLLAAALPDHPYQNAPGLVADALKDLSLGDVNDLLEHWFVPGNATLFVIGDVQPPLVFDLVRRHFAELPWAEPPSRAAPPEVKPERVFAPEVPAARPGADIAWITPPAGTFDNTALDVLMHRLCNPVDGPLYRRLREAGCLPPRWRHEAWADLGWLVLEIDAEDGRRVREIAALVLEEVDHAVRTIPTEAELNRARALAVRELRSRRATFAARALDLATQELVGGDLLRAELELPAIERTSVGDLQAAAKIMRGARTAILPRGPGLLATSSSSVPTSSPALRPLRARSPEPLDSAAVLELLAQHANGVPAVLTPRAAGTVMTQALGNNVMLTACTLPGAGTTVVRTILHGHLYLRDGLHAIMTTGSTRRSAEQCRDYLSYHGLDLFPLGERGRCGLESRGPASRTAQMVELQAELLRWPDRSDAACKVAYDRLYALADLRTHTRSEARREELYLPPGMIGWREPGLFLPINPAEVASKVADLAETERVDVIIVGDVAAETALRAVRDAWGDWKSVVMNAGPPDRDFDTGMDRREDELLSAIAKLTGKPMTVTQWTTDPLETPLIAIQDMLRPAVADRTMQKLALQVAARCVGAPDENSMSLGPRRAWRWQCSLTFDDTLLLAGDPGGEGIGEALAAAIARALGVQTGEVPHLDTAIRLARADRLLSLDSSEGVADLLEYGVRSPWDLQDGQTTTDIAGLLPQVYRVYMRVIAGTGPRDLSAEVERFQHPATTTAPVSP